LYSKGKRGKGVGRFQLSFTTNGGRKQKEGNKGKVHQPIPIKKQISSGSGERKNKGATKRGNPILNCHQKEGGILGRNEKERAEFQCQRKTPQKRRRVFNMWSVGDFRLTQNKKEKRD